MKPAEVILDLTSDQQRPISFKLSLPTNRKSILAKCIPAAAISPFLSLKSSHEQRSVCHAKKPFQYQLLDRLQQAWNQHEGADSISKDRFLHLVETLDVDGAALFGGLVGVPTFERLISCYSKILDEAGSTSFLHSFVNLANYPDFLTNETFNKPFLHPLLIALIAYRMGGAVRITDARGKDTKPISVLAQDNMLHIDNSPFTEEYKINLSWRQGAACGPSGQCLTYLPGTHRGTRKVSIDSAGKPWSTENASIFTTRIAVDQLFAFQEEQLGRAPTVVEAHYLDQPLTVVFEAGSLVHHRYRTETGDARSSIIIAFHLASDDQGALLDEDTGSGNSFSRFLLDYQGSDYSSIFLDMVAAQASAIAEKLAELERPDANTHLVDSASLALSPKEVLKWKAAVTSAPSVSQIRASNGVRLYDQVFLSHASLLERLSHIMALDKYGRLDLILYFDGHEEVRKWARNRIRERGPEIIKNRIAKWLPEVEHMAVEDHLMLPRDLSIKAITLAELAAQNSHRCYVLQPGETIAPAKALQSTQQLAIDLGEAIDRCQTTECFLVTSLFLFWVADDLAVMLPNEAAERAKSHAEGFLKNYIASMLLVEAAC